MFSELSTIVPLATMISDSLRPLSFRPLQIRSRNEGSTLLESIQMIMNGGVYNHDKFSALHKKLLEAIKEQHPKENSRIAGKSPEAYCDAIVKTQGDWPTALRFLSKILSVKFYVYKIVDGSVQPQPSEIGNSLPHLESCAYLIFDVAKQYYQPLCLFDSKVDEKVIKSKFFVNGPHRLLLEKFVNDANLAGTIIISL